MILELKHLAIDHGGKVDLIREDEKFKSLNVDLIRCSLHYNDVIGEYYLVYKSVTYCVFEVFPHRRPLSDLTKEIESNEMVFDFASTFEVYDNYTLEDYMHDHQGVNPIDLPYHVFEEMLKHHFNAFNLPEELYIKK